MPNYRLTRPVINGQRKFWYAVWSENGRSRRISSGQTDKSKALEWLELFKAEYARPLGAWTIGRIYLGYLDAVGPPQARVSAKHLLPVFTHMRPETLTQAHIDGYMSDRQKVVSIATYTTELRYLRASLNWAVRTGHIESFRPFKIPSGRTVRYRFYTEDEFNRIAEGCKTMALRLFVEIAMATASRPSKIYRLKWADIDPQAKIIYFETGNQTKRTRPVPINWRLSWVLGIAYPYRMGEYVIERNGKPVKTLTKQFRELVDSLGIKDATLRDFRGTAASWALQRGAPIEKVADLLGDSVEVVERHYGHFSPGHIASVTDLLG